MKKIISFVVFLSFVTAGCATGKGAAKAAPWELREGRTKIYVNLGKTPNAQSVQAQVAEKLKQEGYTITEGIFSADYKVIIDARMQPADKKHEKGSAISSLASLAVLLSPVVAGVLVTPTSVAQNLATGAAYGIAPEAAGAIAGVGSDKEKVKLEGPVDLIVVAQLTSLMFGDAEGLLSIGGPKQKSRTLVGQARFIEMPEQEKLNEITTTMVSDIVTWIARPNEWEQKHKGGS